MLDVRNLSVEFGETRVIEDISLRLDDDEILMLVGPTGCGKTTFLRTLAGLVPPSQGELRIGSLRIDARHDVAPEKRGVGMVFQDFALFPHLTVMKNVAFRLKDPAPALHWLELLGLSHLADAMPQTLSGGQKQRVSLARALAHAPSLMLLDEPLSNLDAALKDSLRWEIRTALKEAGVPAVWVTHDQEEALSVGDRVGILNGGKLEQLDTPENCFTVPSTRFVARFLGEASFLPGQYREDSHGGVVETCLGTVPAHAMEAASGSVDLLVRPDDLLLSPAEQVNDCGAVVEWCRYEGGTRLYSIRLADGTRLQARCNHENHLQIDQPVKVELHTTHPLAAFR